MKKLVVSIVAVLTGLGLSFAQNFKMEANGKAITEGETIVVSGAVQDGLFEEELKLVIINTSAATVWVKPTFNTEGMPEGANPQFCARECYGNINAIPVLEIAANGTLGKDEDVHVACFGSITDTATLVCTFTDTAAHASLNFSVKFVPEKSDVAIERNEMAGVSVYPNPSNGLFNLVVPARANVEIFSANGQVVRQMEVSAGQNALQLENAGIYFVRVRANGQEAVKRVVVR